MRWRPTEVSQIPLTVAALEGFDITAAARRYLEPHLWLEFTDVPRSGVRVDYDELRQDRPLGVITKLENNVNNLGHILAAVVQSQATIAAEADRARAQYGQPFPHREALAATRSRSAQLAADLAEQRQHPGRQTPLSPRLRVPMRPRSARRHQRRPHCTTNHSATGTRPPTSRHGSPPTAHRVPCCRCSVRGAAPAASPTGHHRVRHDVTPRPDLNLIQHR
jgi:hypothetical protein